MRGRRPRPLDEEALYYLVGEEGFEPSHTDPESVVLPLDDSPALQYIIYNILAFGKCLFKLIYFWLLIHRMDERVLLAHKNFYQYIGTQVFSEAFLRLDFADDGRRTMYSL